MERIGQVLSYFADEEAEAKRKRSVVCLKLINLWRLGLSGSLTSILGTIRENFSFVLTLLLTGEYVQALFQSAESLHILVFILFAFT